MAYKRNPKIWLKWGAAFLIITAVGHLFFVDVSLKFLQSSIVSVEPTSFYHALSDATYDWGVLGRNSAARIYFGFSLWLSFSLIVFAVWSLRSQQDLASMRTAVALCTFCSVVFAVISYAFFIIPPVLGGAGAAFCYGYAYYIIANEGQIERVT